VHTLEYCIPRVTMIAAMIYNPPRNVNGCLFIDEKWDGTTLLYVLAQFMKNCRDSASCLCMLQYDMFAVRCLPLRRTDIQLTHQDSTVALNLRLPRYTRPPVVIGNLPAARYATGVGMIRMLHLADEITYCFAVHL
jgi:hypothetical protein